jgi:uncharacterized protein YndB with AHSA1/START domain
MKFTNSVEISAAPEAVFLWIDDPERGKQWATSVTGGETIHRTPERLGTTFQESVGREGHTIEMQGVITEYVLNERFAVHLESPRHTADVRFTLTRLQDSTRLTRELDLRLKGFMKYGSVFLRPMLKRNINKEAQGEFATLKRLCEAQKPG